MKGGTEIVKKFNAYLILLESKLYDTHYTLIRENEIITAESLKNKYTGATDRQRMLSRFFKNIMMKCLPWCQRNFLPVHWNAIKPVCHILLNS